MGNAALKLEPVSVLSIDWADDCAPSDLMRTRGYAAFAVVFDVRGRDVRAEVTVRRHEEPRNGSVEWSVGCCVADGSSADVAAATVWLIHNEDDFLRRVWRMCMGY